MLAISKEPLITVCENGHESKTMIITKQVDEHTETAEVTIPLTCRRCDE